MRSEKQVADAGNISEPRGSGMSVIESHYQATAGKDSEYFVCCTYSDLWKAQLGEAAVVHCSCGCKCPLYPVTNPNHNQTRGTLPKVFRAIPIHSLH
jgi:hypothetical protein